MCTGGSCHNDKMTRAWKWPFHLILRSWKSGAIPPFPIRFHNVYGSNFTLWRKKQDCLKAVSVNEAFIWMGLRILAAVTVLWLRAVLYIYTDVTEESPTSCIMFILGGKMGGVCSSKISIYIGTCRYISPHIGIHRHKSAYIGVHRFKSANVGTHRYT